MNLGPILFAAPGALLALAALPVLWWLMRATPPPPQRTQFPPARLLLGLRTEDQARERAPLWLLLLRALAAALLILAFARPSLSPGALATANGGRTLIVIDDGWTAAPSWSDARAAAISAASDAERAGAPVFFLLTAPNTPARDPAEALTAADARAFITRLEPQPWRPDRADAARRLEQSQARYDRIVWISDGLADSGADALAAALMQRGPVSAYAPQRTARALIAGAVTTQGVVVEARRAENGPSGGAIAAETADGRALGAGELRFPNGALTARARVDLPPEIAARAARVRIVSEQGAGALRLLPSGASRPFVGLIDPGGAGQPLLSDLYYIERALAPYASLQRGGAGQLIDARAQALVLPDAGQLSPADGSAIKQWVERGGLLVRFAGPRLANAPSDELLPVRLRPGARSLGGALAWETPLKLGAFPQDGPFAGVATPSDVTVRRQVLADPLSLTEALTWATLSDGSPLVTARPLGRGLVVLFHISGAPDWSDLPLSGAFVELLRRTLAFAARGEGAGEREITGGPYVARSVIDGFGALAPAPPDARPIDPEAFALATPSQHTPPGLYERAGLTAAIDAARADESLTPLQLPQGVARLGLGAGAERPLAGWFFAAAAAMIALDLMIALLLIGRLPGFGRAAALIVVAALVGAPDAHAQSREDPTQIMRLAYVRTGDARIDRASAAGLNALSRTLAERTSVEPGAPMAIDLERDELAPYPFLYWPAPPNPHRLSDRALANIDRYLAIGGLLLVDTRDAGRAPQDQRPAAVMLAGVDAPPLERVTDEHVLARAFYLMHNFPGRTQGTQLWAESALAASARDGVASLFVGDGDWAAAWAGEGEGGPRQRELALRFGVNLVMVALVGNYKADQVHVPALLERLGRQP